MDTRELAWASGLFDGEGCISITNRSGKDRAQVQGTMQLNMTDEDSVRRFHQAMGMGAVDTLPQRPGLKQVWRWRISTFEDMQAAVAMLWYGLSDRRKSRAAEILHQTAEARIRWGRPRRKRT